MGTVIECAQYVFTALRKSTLKLIDQKSNLFLLILLIGLFPPSLAAKMRLNSALHYRNTTSEIGTSKSDSSLTLIDLGLLYGDNAGLQIGALYAKSKTEISGATANGNSYGPSLGYRFKSVGLVGTYYVSSEYKSGSSINKGTGWQADLTYLLKGSGGINFGFQLSHRNITYTKDETGDLTEDIIITTTDPMIVISLEF